MSKKGFTFQRLRRTCPVECKTTFDAEFWARFTKSCAMWTYTNKDLNIYRCTTVGDNPDLIKGRKSIWVI